MKKLNVKIFLLTLLSIFCFNFLAWAGNVNVQEINKVKKLVNDAVNYLANGGNLDELNKRHGKFFRGNLYVFVYDCQDKGVILKAHPFLVGKLVGKNVATIRDKKGKFLCLSLCRAVKEHPNGAWDSYYWINPKNHKLEEKFTYIKKVPGKNLEVAAGAYKSDLGDVTVDLLNAKYR